MATSTQLTYSINQSANPLESEHKLWLNSRYLVAQRPAVKDYTQTTIGYYKGRVVIPGPKANPDLSEILTFDTSNIYNYQQFKKIYHITFTDYKCMANADANVRQALYTIMSKAEADEYEESLRKELNVDRRKAVSS